MILSLVWVVGCTSQPSAPVAAKVSSQPNEPTPQEIERVKQRLHLLRPEMTEQQMRSTLGIKDSWVWLGEGGGPRSYYWMRGTTLNGHTLVTIRGVVTKQISGKTVLTSTLISVSLDGETWTANPQTHQ
jgi:hypothetical protein